MLMLTLLRTPCTRTGLGDNPNAVIKLPISKTRRVQGVGSAPKVLKRELRAFQLLQHLQPTLQQLLPSTKDHGADAGAGAGAAVCIECDGIPHCYGIHDVAAGRDGRGLVLERVVGTRFDGLAAVVRERKEKPLLAAAAAATTTLRGLVAGLGVRLVAVLRRVHSAGVVHGDLTPCNVMYDHAADRVVLLDFGHCSLNWPAAKTGKSQRGGKRHYVSLRKHKQQMSPLHPIDDLEASCYLLLAAAGDLPWAKLKSPTSKKIRSGKMAMGGQGYKCKSKLATALVDAIRSCRAAQAALGSSIAARACSCPADSAAPATTGEGTASAAAMSRVGSGSSVSSGGGDGGRGGRGGGGATTSISALPLPARSGVGAGAKPADSKTCWCVLYTKIETQLLSLAT